MRLRKLVVVGLAGLISFAAQIADAQEVTTAPTALNGVNFADTHSQNPFTDRFQLDIGPADTSRFANLSPVQLPAPERDDNRSYEVALSARALSGIDVSAAQRANLGFDASGDVARESRSAELRLGRGLVSRRDAPSGEPSIYMFVASEDEALIWRPGGQRNAFGGRSGGFALQDRVEVGDLQAGITYERYGVQASLAYVERKISVSVGRHSASTEERFAGFTLTLRN